MNPLEWFGIERNSSNFGQPDAHGIVTGEQFAGPMDIDMEEAPSGVPSYVGNPRDAIFEAGNAALRSQAEQYLELAERQTANNRSLRSWAASGVWLAGVASMFIPGVGANGCFVTQVTDRVARRIRAPVEVANKQLEIEQEYVRQTSNHLAAALSPEKLTE